MNTEYCVNMNANPKVSVIIPNYNHASFLKERIDSVLGQTYTDYEVIILDDVSTDNSRNIIEQYRSHPKISHIVYNTENTGNTFVQWNKGLELAKGELVWIAESDDSCDKQFLSSLVIEFEKDTQCVMAFVYSQFIDEKGQILGYKVRDRHHTTRISGKECIQRYLALENNHIKNASSVLFKRDIALRIDKQYMTFVGAGDLLFWIEIAEHGNVAIVERPLNFFRRHRGVVTSRCTLNGTNSKETYRILQYMDKKDLLPPFRRWLAIWKCRDFVDCNEFLSMDIKKQLIELWGSNNRMFSIFIKIYLKIERKYYRCY